MDHAVDALREAGEGFLLNLTTSNGHAFEAMGRAIGGQAIVRIRELSGLRRELAETNLRHKALLEETEMLRGFAAAAPWPIWTKRAKGGLSYANAAYARATEAASVADAIDRDLELLDSADRGEMERALQRQGGLHRAAADRGRRRAAHLRCACAAMSAAAAPASPSTPAKPPRSARRWCGWRKRIAAPSTNCRPASPCSTASGGWRSTTIPIAGCGISTAPSSTTIPTIRACSTGCAPRASCPSSRISGPGRPSCTRPIARSSPKKIPGICPTAARVSVVTTPNPEGGVTYLFDDVTESLDLARRFDGLIRVQRETLDNLAEAVAVFGSNGRAQLFNPAFAKMWKLSPEALQEQPHIETVEAWCRPLFDDAATWRTLREAITAIENRVEVPLKLERKDGSVLDCMTMPLPDGATMLTFQDITDTENVERALRERNEALETADQMKVDFVHHVSYELRSPLTTIIGFAHLLSDPATGPLMPKQAEYLDYITASTNALFALINNILDLATIDAGAMTLELGSVDIRKTIEAAAEGIQDRLATDRIELKVDVDPNIGSFVGDEKPRGAGAV